MTDLYDDYPGIDPVYIPEWQTYQAPEKPCEHFRLYVRDRDDQWQHVASLGWPGDDCYFRIWFQPGMEGTSEGAQAMASIRYYLRQLPMDRLLSIQTRYGHVPLMDAEQWLKGVWLGLVGNAASAATHYSDVLWRHRLPDGVSPIAPDPEKTPMPLP